MRRTSRRRTAPVVERVVAVAALRRLHAGRAAGARTRTRRSASRVAVSQARGDARSRARRSPRRRGARRARTPSSDRCPGAARSRPRRRPSGRRSRPAAAGRSRRARRRARHPAGRRRRGPPRWSCSATAVHQTALVRRWRAGRSSGSSPSTWPVTQPPPEVGDDLGGDLDVPERQLGLAPAPRALTSSTPDVGDVAREVRRRPAVGARPGRRARRGRGVHDVGRPLVHVDRARRARSCAAAPGRPCRAPGRCRPRRPHRLAAGAAQVGEVAGAVAARPEPAARTPPQHPAGDQARPAAAAVVGAEQREVGLGQRQLGGRGAQVRAEHVGVVGSSTVASHRPAEDAPRGGARGRCRAGRRAATSTASASPPRRPARPACCHSDARRPGQPASSTASSPVTSTPSSSAFVAATPEQRAGAQGVLEGTPLLGQVAGRGRPRPGRPAGVDLGRAASGASARRPRPRGGSGTNASVRTPSMTRSARRSAVSAVARRGGSGRRSRRRRAVQRRLPQRERRSRPRGDASSVTASHRRDRSAGRRGRPGRRTSPRRARTSARRRSGAATRRSRRRTGATCEPNTPR